MRDAGSIAPELPASRRTIREYSRFCGRVKRAFSPSVCPIVQIPPSVDIFRSKVVATVGFYRHAPLFHFGSLVREWGSLLPKRLAAASNRLIPHLLPDDVGEE